MSTEEYLQDLNDSQLDMAITLAEAIKKERAAEKTIKIWVVSGGGLNHKAFAEDDHESAVDGLISSIKRKAKLYPNTRMEFELHRQEIRESTLESWLNLKNGY